MIAVPVSKAFALQAREHGFHATAVGSEAVFDLEEYFSRGVDPNRRFPHARSLARRGARVVELDPRDLAPEHETAIQKLARQWRESKPAAPLGFLNQVAPLHLKEHKKIFALFLQGKMLAFLSAMPIPATRSMFFADYIRAPESRAGTMELLFIESMRALKETGYRSVRLGLCPFARLNLAPTSSFREKLLYRAMKLIFKHSRYPFRFQSVYAFKEKFEPTAWDELYVVSDRKIGLRTLIEVYKVQLGNGPFRDWLLAQLKKGVNVLRPEARLLSAPRSVVEGLRRSAMTLSFSTLFLILHGLRIQIPLVQKIFEASAYVPGHVTSAGILIAPLFHNNAYHLGGDLLTFLLLGAIVEIFKGHVFAFGVFALGLWASNPMTHAIVGEFLPQLNSIQWTAFLKEKDYGSSNAAYALVGALAALMRRPSWLLLPFLLNGVFLCISRESWLSLHHLTGMGLGYAFSLLVSAKKAQAAGTTASSIT